MAMPSRTTPVRSGRCRRRLALTASPSARVPDRGYSRRTERCRATPLSPKRCVPACRVSACNAAVRCDGHGRQRLEQLCRSGRRPALVNERVQCNAAGQDLNQFHGVLAPNDKLTALVVPDGPEQATGESALAAIGQAARTTGRRASAGPGFSDASLRSTSNTARTAAGSSRSSRLSSNRR